jgi:hypothetical protein
MRSFYQPKKPNRLKMFWLTLKALWRTFSIPARVLITLFFMAGFLILILSPDREFWLVICGVLTFFSLLSGYIVYRLLSREIK